MASLGHALLANPGAAQKRYDPGAADAEIKIGNINPHSGPASSYGVIGKTDAAHFMPMTAIDGRKIDFTSYDDSHSPPKTVERARELVESNRVLPIFQSIGTHQTPRYRST